MALTLTSGVGNFFDATIMDARPYEAFAKAQAGNIAAIHRLYKAPQFTIQAKTTDNTAASEVLDLTTLGVLFPANTKRKIRFRSRAKTDNDVYTQEWEQYVLGGTTPKLVGSAVLLNATGVINGTPVQYGNCRAQATYAQDTATAVTAHSTLGSSLGDNSTNTITLTHPIARATPKRIVSINASSDAVTATEGLHVSGYVAGGTSTTILLYAMDLATPSADGFDDVGVLDVNFFIVPPPSIALVMNSNNVEVHCGHDATDDVYHDVEIYLDPLDFNTLVAD